LYAHCPIDTRMVRVRVRVRVWNKEATAVWSSWRHLGKMNKPEAMNMFVLALSGLRVRVRVRVRVARL
jgi:hypothetical protein